MRRAIETAQADTTLRTRHAPVAGSRFYAYGLDRRYGGSLFATGKPVDRRSGRPGKRSSGQNAEGMVGFLTVASVDGDAKISGSSFGCLWTFASGF